MYRFKIWFIKLIMLIFRVDWNYKISRIILNKIEKEFGKKGIVYWEEGNRIFVEDFEDLFN